jgi:hypothetical protein
MHRGSFPASRLARSGAAGTASLPNSRWLSDSVGLGRGPGYAIERNDKLTDLDTAVRGIQPSIKRK